MTTPRKKKPVKPVHKAGLSEIIDSFSPDGLIDTDPGKAIPSAPVETNVTIYVNTKTGMFWINKVITSNHYNDSPENHIYKIGREGFIHENVYYPPHSIDHITIDKNDTTQNS